uniref:Putative ovule protein n=1 Tax=Solanum chacoense TaxID=4108 RepID=A0A0V0H459_SOLCH
MKRIFHFLVQGYGYRSAFNMKIEIALLAAIVWLEQKMNRIIMSTSSTMKLLIVVGQLKRPKIKSVVIAGMKIMVNFSWEVTTHFMKVIITMLLTSISPARDTDIAKGAIDSFNLSKVKSKQWMTMAEGI